MKSKSAGPLRKTIADILAPLGQGGRLVETGIVANWPRIVGPQIADHSFPCHLRGGILTVGVAGSAWLNQLHFFREDIAHKINEYAGEALVGEVRLVPRKKPAVSGPPIADSPSFRELDAADLAEIEAACLAIADLELRKIVRRFLTRQAASTPRKG